MTDKELVPALRRNMVETGSLICLGCGYEHNCGVHGCAIMREAAEWIESHRPQPLTLDELREMDGQPVWIEPDVAWGIVSVDFAGGWANIPFAHLRHPAAAFHSVCGVNSEVNLTKKHRVCYRTKPEEGREP